MRTAMELCTHCQAILDGFAPDVVKYSMDEYVMNACIPATMELLRRAQHVVPQPYPPFLF